jgi:hypothetical protein
MLLKNSFHLIGWSFVFRALARLSLTFQVKRRIGGVGLTKNPVCRTKKYVCAKPKAVSSRPVINFQANPLISVQNTKRKGTSTEMEL